MKNTILAIALASGLAALPIASHAANSGFFVNGNIGQSNFDKGHYDDDDTGYGVNLGYRWAVAPNFLLGVEGGYVDLGEASAKRGYSPLIGKAELSGWNLGVNGHWNLTDNWYLSGRGGYFRGDLKGGYVSAFVDPSNYVVSRVDDNSNKWYAGAGFGYDFSNNASIGLNYDYYKATKSGLDINPKVVSVSAEYRF